MHLGSSLFVPSSFFILSKCSRTLDRAATFLFKLFSGGGGGMAFDDLSTLCVEVGVAVELAFDIGLVDELKVFAIETQIN